NEEAEGISVLVVEDNEELRHFMVNILRKDYHVIEAENGKTGLEKIKSKIPDLVISDIMMPCLDGIELLEEVKKDYNVSHIPFVLLSAKATLDDRIKGLEYGADDYITKPFSSGYLRARISSLLKQRSILREHFMKEVLPVAGKEPVAIQGDALENLSPSVPQITSYDEEFIHKIIQAVEERLQDSDFKIEDLADSMNIGRSVFYKKVKSILGVSPIELVKDMRIKRAIQLLETGNYNISQIAYMSGFSSSQYFSRVFKELKNCTPSEYKIKN
ncbi:response regulator transcription factor, partial [Bacteroides cellulosilyticus]